MGLIEQALAELTDHDRRGGCVWLCGGAVMALAMTHGSEHAAEMAYSVADAMVGVDLPPKVEAVRA
jgi:hypothetical protein